MSTEGLRTSGQAAGAGAQGIAAISSLIQGSQQAKTATAIGERNAKVEQKTPLELDGFTRTPSLIVLLFLGAFLVLIFFSLTGISLGVPVMLAFSQYVVFEALRVRFHNSWHLALMLL